MVHWHKQKCFFLLEKEKCLFGCSSHPWNMTESEVKISFDKVVVHLFSDSMSLVTHYEVTPWFVPSRESLQNLSCPDCWKLLSKTPSDIFLSSFAASNWRLWIWVHGFLLLLKCSSLQQELKCLWLQCSWNLVWNNWIGCRLEVIIMQLISQCFAKKNSKISLVF